MSDNIYPKPENDLAVKTCVITAAIVSFLGMLDTSLSAEVFWIVGFGCVNYVFQRAIGFVCFFASSRRWCSLRSCCGSTVGSGVAREYIASPLAAVQCIHYTRA